MQIKAFLGRAGAGKDYQCNLLTDYKKLSFADALRDIAFNSLDIPLDIGKKLYDKLKTQYCIDTTVWDNNTHHSLYYQRKLTFRQFLEFLGTQGIRKYDNDFWCRCLIKQIQDNNYDKVCISDLRFINEYEYLKDFAKENIQFIFCDYHSDRYQSDNTHESALMGNYFATNGYKDLQVLNDEDFYNFKEWLRSRNG